MQNGFAGAFVSHSGMIIASNPFAAYNFLRLMSETLNRRLRVFLCHSSRDQSIARELYQQLKTEQWMEVWFIEASLLPSQDWDLEIRRAIRNSDMLIFLCSKNSIETEETSYPNINFVLDVLHKKPQRWTPIILLRLDSGQAPISLKTKWTIDYFPRSQRKLTYQNLLGRLKSRAEWLDISMDMNTPPIEAEKTLQWSPWNWRNLASDNWAYILEDQSPYNGEYDSSQNMEQRRFDRTNKRGANLWIMIGLLTLLIFWLMKNYLAMDQSAVHAVLPIPAPTLGIGSIHVSSKDSMKMVYVPAGEFIMGGDVYYDEKPVHIVDLNAFWIDQTEVTNAMFAAFLTEEGNREESEVTWLDSSDEDTHIHLGKDSWQVDQGYEDYPVIEVTWYGAVAYCSWAGHRLPTEAEWEKAARGTNGNMYPWGNEAPTANLLNFDNNMDGPIKTGSYPNGGSPYGALDMAGNVWEWVADKHSRTYYATSPTDNPLGPETGFFRVLRGGAWNYHKTYARSMHRNRGIPTISHDSVGFRCARNASLE